MIQNAQKLKNLLNMFPLHENISYCFAYGSAVFDQSLKQSSSSSELYHNSKSKSQMVDLVLVVNNPLKWHQANLTKNWSHYSNLRYLGPKNIAYVQEKFGAKVYYNTLVPITKDMFIKYGIISTEDFINDLLDWETLYLSGRLHKPTLILHQNNTEEKFDSASSRIAPSLHLKNALGINQQSALHAALLLLPERFTEEQLYMTIANLSYSGDFRMWFGEDRSKIEKIVRPQMSNFHQIYLPLIKSDLFNHLVRCSDDFQQSSGGFFEQNCSNNSIQWHLSLLPKTVQFHIGRRWLAENTLRRHTRHKASMNVYHFDMDDLMRAVAFDLEYRHYLYRAIQTIVFKSSVIQSIKGFFTAGPSKSVVYSVQKIQKMFQSLRKTERI